MNEGVVIQIASSGRTKTTVVTVVAMALTLAFIASSVCWLLLGIVLGEARGPYLEFARAYAWVLAPSSYISLCLLAIYQGEMRFSQFNAIRVLQTGMYPFTLGCLWLLGVLTVPSAACAALLGGVVVAAYMLYRFSPDLKMKPSLEEGKAIAAKSIRLHAVNIMMSLTEQLDKMILVLWSSNSQLGQYVVAYTAAAAGPTVLTQTYINVMLPAAARVEGNQLRYEAIVRSLKVMVTVVVLAGVAVITALPILMPFAFGSEFAAATPYAQVLTVALSIYGMRKCMVYLLRSWQVSRPAIRAESLTSGCVLIGGYQVFGYAGVIGMCWLLVVAQAIGTALLWKDFLRFAKLRYLTTE